jgi:hypothetical protein
MRTLATALNEQDLPGYFISPLGPAPLSKRGGPGLSFDLLDQLLAGNADIAEQVLRRIQQIQQCLLLGACYPTGGDPPDNGTETTDEGELDGTAHWGQIGDSHFASPTV